MCKTHCRQINVQRIYESPKEKLLKNNELYTSGLEINHHREMFHDYKVNKNCMLLKYSFIFNF